MASKNPQLINGADPAILRTFPSQSFNDATISPPTISSKTGLATSQAKTVAPGIAPRAVNNSTVYPSATESVVGNSVVINSATSNDPGDIVTVYNTDKSISVSSVNQTVNNYKVTNVTSNSGVSQIIAGDNITISSTGANGIGAVTINATGGATDYSNANVANYLPTYTGNVSANWIIADYISGNATPLHHIPGANVTGTVDNAVHATVASSANSVAVANVTGIGNIATINKDGNASNVLYGNGVFAAASSGNPFNQDLNTTDNVTFANITSTDAIRFKNLNNIVGALGYAPTYLSIESYGSNSVQITTNDLLTWSFNSEGILTFPEGTTTTGSSIETPPGDDFSITTSSITSVSAPCVIAVGDEFVADTEFNDDITVVQVGWTVSIGGTDYTVTYIDPSPPAHQYRITAAGATFVQNTTYTFSDPIPATHNWTISETGVLSTPGGGTISQQSDFIISVSGTDRIDLRTENGDAILDAEGNLNLTGNLVFSGGAIIDPTDNNFEVRGIQNVNFEANSVVNIYTDGSGNAYQWQFGDDGNLTLPDGSYIFNGKMYGNTEDGGTIGNATGIVQVYARDNGVGIQTYDTPNLNYHTWTFSMDGNIYLPDGDGISINYANGQPYGGPVNPFNQDLNTTDNVTFANITSTDAIRFSNSSNIVGALGYAPTAISIEGYGSNTVNITANDVYTWSFDGAGNLSVPVNINFNGGGLKQVLNEDFYIRASDNEADGWSIFNVVDDGAGNTLTQTRLEYNQYTVRTNAQGNSYTWAFRDSGVLDLPGDIYGNAGGNLTIKIGDQSGSNTFIDLQTRSYVGDALISNIHIANPNVTISTSNAAYSWTFDGNGTLTVPNEGLIQSLNDTIILRSKDTGTGNRYDVRLGTNGGLYFETTEYSQGWLNIVNNAGNANINAIPGTGGAGGKSIYINGGAADQTDFYTTSGGNVNLTGGLGASNDGGGGGPGGSINLTAGNSADPSGVSGSINITTGSNVWTFNNIGQITLPGNQGYIGPSVAGNPDLRIYNDQSSGFVRLGWQPGAVLTPGANVASNVTLDSTGFTVTTTSDSFTTTKNWVFDTAGNLTLPGNYTVGETGNTLFISAPNTSDGIYLDWNSEISFYAGNAGAQNVAQIGTLGGTWIFDNDGVMSAPGNINAAGANITGNISGGNISTTGAITATGKIGYSTGGAVTQTGTGQGVTLNQLTGKITLAKSSWNAGDLEAFNISCNKIADGDMVLVQVVDSINAPLFNAAAYKFTPLANSIQVLVKCLETVSSTPVVQFMIVKAPVS